VCCFRGAGAGGQDRPAGRSWALVESWSENTGLSTGPDASSPAGAVGSTSTGWEKMGFKKCPLQE
jgi:hypothetical protein